MCLGVDPRMDTKKRMRVKDEVHACSQPGSATRTSVVLGKSVLLNPDEY